MPRAVITHARRTPIARFLGSFRDLSAVDLGKVAVTAVLGEAEGRVAPDQVIFGCARQAGLGPNPARQVALRSGLPDSIHATTTNMACGSGLLAIIQAARAILLGEARCVVAGGTENMTRVPFLLPQGRLGYRLGHGKMVDAMYQDGFDCPLAGQVMGATAETLAQRYDITREEQDVFAARSQNRAEAARSRLAEEIAAVEVAGRKGAVTTVDADEHPRAGVTPESLSRLPAVFDPENGTVSAGNSSGITDGAAALLVMEETAALDAGFEPLAAIEAWELAGVDPRIMGIGPVPATRRLLGKLDRELSAYDLIELNEAFAAQVIACDRELGIDPERLNVNGGAIALGHPIGATGARIVTTLLHELRRRDGRLGLATLCISGGQGIALSLSRGSSR